MAPLYGLVLAGGKSSRMGSDKALLNYHGLPQGLHTAGLLKSWVKKVVISSNNADIESDEYEVLRDNTALKMEGPMAGLLSAMLHYPDVAWLTLAVDMPYFSLKNLKKLVEKRSDQFMAIVMCDSSGQPNPTAGIYEPEFINNLQKARKNEEWSIRKILNEVSYAAVLPDDFRVLTSVDNASAMKEALDYIAHLRNP